MHRKRKQCILISVLTLLLLGMIYLIGNSMIDSKKNENILDISLYRIEEVIKRNITNREILKVDENILVGYNKKELENGYYDLKITMSEKTLSVHVNKAWKEFNNKLYEEEYINQLVNSITNIFEIENNDAYNQIYEYIVHGYKVSKGLIDNSLNDKNKLKAEEAILKQKIENNELILSISKEVDK